MPIMFYVANGLAPMELLMSLVMLFLYEGLTAGRGRRYTVPIC